MSESADVRELISFCRIISSGLKSGRPLPEAFLSLKPENTGSKAAEWCVMLSKSLSEGADLAEAVKQLQGLDPVLAKLLPLMGQGKLITVLDHYTRYLAMVETLNQKLQVTFFYPAVIFILLIFNLLHLNFFLFPAALVEFTRENASPGWIMKLLYFANYEFWPFSLILPLLFFLCMLAFFRPWIKNVVSGKSHVSKFTGIDRLLEWQTTAQAQAVVGLYLQSGFTLEKALRSADELLDQSNGFADAADAVSRGFGIRDAFALSPALKDSGYLEDSGMELSEAMLNAAQGNHRITLGMLESFNRFAGIIVIFIAGFFVLCVTAGFFDTYYSLLVAY